MQYCDLHSHSGFSDGQLDPEEIPILAKKVGLSAVALTDHDNVGGLERFMKSGQKCNIITVPGIEISCDFEGRECHVVGLFIRPTENLKNRLVEFREKREERMKVILERMDTHFGMRLDYDDLPHEYGKSIGRPHLARLMVKLDLVKDVQEAFKYLGDHGPANVPKLLFNLEEAVTLIHESKGLAILAHPARNNFMPHLNSFAAKGIDGIEAYCSGATQEETQRVLDFCAEHELAVSGGSDFHGKGHGRELGDQHVPILVYEDLCSRLSEP